MRNAWHVWHGQTGIPFSGARAARTSLPDGVADVHMTIIKAFERLKRRKGRLALGSVEGGDRRARLLRS